MAVKPIPEGYHTVTPYLIIKDAGGATIAEDPSTCVAFGMPQAAIDLGCVDRVVPLAQVARALLRVL